MMGHHFYKVLHFSTMAAPACQALALADKRGLEAISTTLTLTPGSTACIEPIIAAALCPGPITASLVTPPGPNTDRGRKRHPSPPNLIDHASRRKPSAADDWGRPIA
jgi:hypothetical protein